MKISKFFQNRLYIVIAIVIIWVIVFLLIQLGSIGISCLSGLIENIIAEAFWATITIIIIDEILKLHESRRRLPAQLMQVSKLIALNCEYLQKILPEDDYEKRSEIYERGPIQALIRISVKRSEEEILSVLPEKHVLQLSSSDPAPIAALNQQLNAVINTSAFFIEVELFNLLLFWERSNNSLLDILKRDNWADEQSKIIFYLVLKSNIRATLKAREWLLENIHKYLIKI